MSKTRTKQMKLLWERGKGANGEEAFHEVSQMFTAVTNVPMGFERLLDKDGGRIGVMFVIHTYETSRSRRMAEFFDYEESAEPYLCYREYDGSPIPDYGEYWLEYVTYVSFFKLGHYASAYECKEVWKGRSLSEARDAAVTYLRVGLSDAEPLEEST